MKNIKMKKTSTTNILAKIFKKTPEKKVKKKTKAKVVKKSTPPKTKNVKKKKTIKKTKTKKVNTTKIAMQIDDKIFNVIFFILLPLRFHKSTPEYKLLLS